MKRKSSEAKQPFSGKVNQLHAPEEAVPGTAWVLSFLITLAGILCVPQMLVTEGRGLGFSNSFLSVLLLALALPVVHKALWKDRVLDRKKAPWFTCLAAFGFVTACILGSRLEADGYLLLTDAGLWLSLIPLTLFFSVLLGKLWLMMEQAVFKAAEKRTQRQSPASAGGPFSRINLLSVGKRRAAVFLFLMLIWGIVLLAVWPGFFVYDAQDELNQTMMRSFSTHHPLPHVAALGGMILAGNKLFGSYNAGIACYMLFQMAVLAGCFTFVVDFMRKKAAPVWMRAVSVCYFAFFPVIQMYVLCSAKDTLYSAGMLVFIVSLVDLVQERQAFLASRRKMAALGAAAFLMASMRHNGLYILVLMIPVLWLWAGKGRRLRAAALGLAALLCAGLVSGALEWALKAEKGGRQEMLTVPIQQLARTYCYSTEMFDGEAEETLFSFIPREALELYRPKLSDPVKIAFQNEMYEKEPGEFWRLWFEIGCKAPVSYLNAWLLTSYGFWYPDVVLDGYRGNTVFTYTYEDSSYFGFETELPGERHSFLPALNELFRKMSLELFQQRMPVGSMLFSPGFLFWVYALGLGFLVHCGLCSGLRGVRSGLYRACGGLRSLPSGSPGAKDGAPLNPAALAFPFLPAVLNWLTVLLGPASLVRYVLIWWFALPVLGYVVSAGKLCYTNTKTVKTDGKV